MGKTWRNVVWEGQRPAGRLDIWELIQRAEGSHYTGFRPWREEISLQKDHVEKIGGRDRRGRELAGDSRRKMMAVNAEEEVWKGRDVRGLETYS